jgi:hypothetical protein
VPLPGDFSITTYTSLAKKLGIPAIPAFSLPSLVLKVPKALKNAFPQIPSVSVNPGAVVDRAATQTASGVAVAMDSADNSALASITQVSPVTGL